MSLCIEESTSTAVLREAWATLPESSSRPLPATLAQSRNLAHASLETAVLRYSRLNLISRYGKAVKVRRPHESARREGGSKEGREGERNFTPMPCDANRLPLHFWVMS